MKITRLESLFVRPRWHFLKMHTDEGIVGLGEPIVEGRARTAATAMRELESYLIYIDLPTTPGLGIELDDEAVRGKLYPGDWETPLLFHADDGSFGER